MKSQQQLGMHPRAVMTVDYSNHRNEQAGQVQWMDGPWTVTVTVDFTYRVTSGFCFYQNSYARGRGVCRPHSFFPIYGVHCTVMSKIHSESRVRTNRGSNMLACYIVVMCWSFSQPDNHACSLQGGIGLSLSDCRGKCLT